MNDLVQYLWMAMHSQLFGGGIALMLSGSLLALARNVPAQFGAWVKRRMTLEVEILSNDSFFYYVTYWLNNQPYSRRSRRLTAITANDQEEEGPVTLAKPSWGVAKVPKILLSPAPGTHIFMHKGSLLWLHRQRDNAPAGGSYGQGPKKLEEYHLTVLGWDQKVIREVIDEIALYGAIPRSTIRLFHSAWGNWQTSGSIKPRSLDSVILPKGVAEELLNDAKKFLTSADWYRSVGIPWHRGYLLYGKPGTGKTSLVGALAGELHMDLYLLNIGSNLDDEKLAGLMADVPNHTIVLMEDVDCTMPTRGDKDKQGVTLGGILNCLDGIQSREGCMIFMTTNFVEKLDAAITRPGRVDKKIEFYYATLDQLVRLQKRLAPDYPYVPQENVTMAEAQQFFLSKADNRVASPDHISLNAGDSV